jgi:hypothetical protein
VPGGSGIEETATDSASWRGRQRYRILKHIVVSFGLDSVYLTVFKHLLRDLGVTSQMNIWGP